jgi:hypothetical protein
MIAPAAQKLQARRASDQPSSTPLAARHNTQHLAVHCRIQEVPKGCRQPSCHVVGCMKVAAPEAIERGPGREADQISVATRLAAPACRCHSRYHPRGWSSVQTAHGAEKPHLAASSSAGGGTRTRTPPKGTPDFKSGAYDQFRHPGGGRIEAHARESRPARASKRCSQPARACEPADSALHPTRPEPCPARSDTARPPCSAARRGTRPRRRRPTAYTSARSRGPDRLPSAATGPFRTAARSRR